MLEAVNALTAFGEFLAGSKVVLLVLSLGLNVWQALELRRINQERISDLKEARERSDRNRTLTKEVIEVMAAFNRKIGP